MDAISYSYADKAHKRIKRIIENPDSNSGIVTVPKVIASGENITIPTGRVAVLPNVQVDGTLNIDGEVFIPSGASFSDLESQIALKQDILVANDSSVKTALNASGTAPIYACRAWVNFNGTGTVAIRASGNVSSITDNGTGDYTVNFTIPMQSAYYSHVALARKENDSTSASFLTPSMYLSSIKTKNLFQIITKTTAQADSPEVNIAVFE